MKCISSLQCSFGGWWRKVWMEGCGRQYYHYYYHYYYICSLFDSLPPVFIYIYIYIYIPIRLLLLLLLLLLIIIIWTLFLLSLNLILPLGGYGGSLLRSPLAGQKRIPPLSPLAPKQPAWRAGTKHTLQTGLLGEINVMWVWVALPKNPSDSESLYFITITTIIIIIITDKYGDLQPSFNLPHNYISIYLYIYRSIYLSYIDNPLFPTNTSKLLPTYLFPTYLISIYFITAIVVVFVLRTHSWKTPSPAWKVSGRILELTRLTAYLTLPYLTLPYPTLPYLTFTHYHPDLHRLSYWSYSHDFRSWQHILVPAITARDLLLSCPLSLAISMVAVTCQKTSLLATLVQYSTEKAGKSLFNCQKRLVVL